MYFNAIPDRQLDVSDKACNWTGRATLSHSMSSVWRCQHSTERDYSYFSNVHSTNSRIYLFLVDKFLLQNVSVSSIHNSTWSDHAPISIVVEGPRTETRANRRKNDVFVVEHPKHKLKIANKLQEFFKLIPFLCWILA